MNIPSPSPAVSEPKGVEPKGVDGNILIPTGLDFDAVRLSNILNFTQHYFTQSIVAFT